MFHQPHDHKSKSIPAQLLLPTDSDNIIESLTWHYEFVCFSAAGGDIETYRHLFDNTDWAEVYKIYVLRQVIRNE